MSVTRARSVVALGAYLAVLGGCAPADRVAAPGTPPGGTTASTGTPGTGGPSAAAEAGVVISQVYGGGGNAGAVYRNDFIELFNAGTTPVTVTGWSVQYASSTGTSWQVTTLAGTIEPGRYYLVQQGAGANLNAQPLPAPNATGSIAMSATAGKVALVRAATALTGACPVGANANLVDFVGFGTGTNCFEGSAPTATLSNTTGRPAQVEGRQDIPKTTPPTSRRPAQPAQQQRRRAEAGPVTGDRHAGHGHGRRCTVRHSPRAPDAPPTRRRPPSPGVGDPPVATVNSAGVVTGRPRPSPYISARPPTA
jgi:predicted extracellular nuclease